MQIEQSQSPLSAMTSRERVLKAIHHQETDRLPIDFGGMASTGIMAIAYDRLKKHLGITSGEIRVFDLGQQLAEVEPEILSRFGVDVISLGNSLGEAPELWKPWKLPNGVDCKIPAEVDLRLDEESGGWLIWENGLPMHRMAPGSLYFSEAIHPLADLTTPEELQYVPRPIISDEELKFLEMRAKALYENTDFAIMASFGGNILETGNSLRGFTRFMMDLAMGGAFVEDLIGGIVETQFLNLTLFLQAVGNYVQIVQFGDDLGMQDRLIISRSMYQKYIFPGHQQLFQYVHQNSNCAVFLHSCGSIRPLIPDLIAAGVDILNPVQTSAENMDPKQLKEEFGKRITFWGGGCDTQHVLPFASPDEVTRHVQEQIEILAPGGGFVFNQIHNIQADIPPNNIVAMFDAARQFKL
ncbi:MAG: methyltransferase [Anaerolineaceae bacterium]|nr:methyltransferase [Anaerolineaceae bacterium]